MQVESWGSEEKTGVDLILPEAVDSPALLNYAVDLLVLVGRSSDGKT